MPSCGKLAVVPEYPRQCMGGFQRGKDAFGAAEGLEGVERFGVVGEPVVDAPNGAQVGVLRSDAGIVEPAETECEGSICPSLVWRSMVIWPCRTPGVPRLIGAEL